MPRSPYSIFKPPSIGSRTTKKIVGAPGPSFRTGLSGIFFPQGSQMTFDESGFGRGLDDGGFGGVGGGGGAQRSALNPSKLQALEEPATTNKKKKRRKIVKRAGTY